jgi:hypothetical protein
MSALASDAVGGTPAIRCQGTASNGRILPAALLALALFGYPLVGNLVSLLGVDSRALSVPFRLLVAMLAVAVIFSSVVVRLNGLRLLLLAFWAAYSLRLLYDTFVAGLEGAAYALQFFVAGCMMPAVAQWFADSYRQPLFARISLVLATAGCVATLGGSALGGFGESDLTDSTGRLSTAALNAVSLGHLAVSAVLCALVLWREASIGSRILLASAVGVALTALLMTGSKGPAFALLVCLAAWSMRRGRLLRLVLLAAPLLAVLLVSSSSPLASRIVNAAEDLSTLDRVILLQDTVRQISSAPLTGSAFVELNSGTYPHNILLEASLAVGLPMAGLLAVLLAIGASRAVSILNSDNDLLGLLFLQALVAGMLSEAMFAASALWCSLALLLGAVPVRRSIRTS